MSIRMSFKFLRTEITDVIIIEPTVHQDERGFFMETYKLSEFADFNLNVTFVQDNHARSARSVLRGLHYQRPPKAQGKLVRVIKGEVFDVAVDIRKGSPTYGRWVGVVLSSDNRRMIYVPVGFAHGFCVLSATAEVLYKVTEEYSPEHENGIIWNDPDIGISWPIHNPIVSKKDTAHPRLKEMDAGFVFESVI